jgi:hypothetical protein
VILALGHAWACTRFSSHYEDEDCVPFLLGAQRRPKIAAKDATVPVYFIPASPAGTDKPGQTEFRPELISFMRSNSAFFWFFIIGGFITAAVGVAYFASGESSAATDEQNYTVLLQIPIGALVSIYGLTKRQDLRRG